MRRSLSLLAVGVAVAAAFAAAPPTKAPGEWLKLIDQLGDNEARAPAARKLDALGENALPVLRRAAQLHADVDVRLRAAVLAGAIENRLYGKEQVLSGKLGQNIAFAVSPDDKHIATVNRL